jgi:hypothetical protein
MSKTTELEISKKDERLVSFLTKMRCYSTKNELTHISMSLLIIRGMRWVNDIPKTSGLEKKEIVCNAVIMMINEFHYEDTPLTSKDIECMIESLFEANVLLKKKRCC